MYSLFGMLQLRFSQSSSVITGFYSRPSIHAKRKIMLDHKTCTVCKNNYFLNVDGKCVDECPTEMTALGKGSQGKFCSRTWVPFAITTSDACAESLPIGISRSLRLAIMVTFPPPIKIMSTSIFYNVFLLMMFCNLKVYGSLIRLLPLLRDSHAHQATVKQ